MHELPEYSSALGPLITKVTLMERSRFCFVQFQNAELATRAIAIFDDTELFGQRLRVRRPRLTPELLEATKSLRQSVARPLSFAALLEIVAQTDWTETLQATQPEDTTVVQSILDVEPVQLNLLQAAAVKGPQLHVRQQGIKQAAVGYGRNDAPAAEADFVFESEPKQSSAMWGYVWQV
eukprot:symbB.v1.2.021648.t1/scaffold1746.1/size103363/6